jgi:hypothetical protein
MKLLTFVVFLTLSSVLNASEFEVKIQRNMTCADNTTIGVLKLNGKQVGRTLELPWKNNEQGVSRIPAGSYSASIRNDGNKGWRIQLKDVPDRGFIQIHIGNYGQEIEGCILVGQDTATNNGKCLVTNSGDTLSRISQEMAKYSAELGQVMSVPIDITVTVID